MSMRRNKKKAPVGVKKDRRPKADSLWVPVNVPSTTGESEIQIGEGTLRNGLLVVKFKDTLGGVAVQRLLERGAILGLQFVMLQTDEANQAKQEALAKEQKIREDMESLDFDSLEEEIEVEPVEVVDVESMYPIEQPDFEADDYIKTLLNDNDLSDASRIAINSAYGVDIAANPEYEESDIPQERVPVFLGEPGVADRPQVGWATIEEGGYANVYWDGEPPFDMGTRVKTNISSEEISVYSVDDEDVNIDDIVDNSNEENNNEENN